MLSKKDVEDKNAGRNFLIELTVFWGAFIAIIVFASEKVQ